MKVKSISGKIIVLLALIVVTSFYFPPVMASDSASHDIEIDIPVIQAMNIKSRSSTGSGEKVVTKYNIPEPKKADLNRGYVEKEDAVTLAVTSNVNWKVTVRAKKRYLGTSDDGTYKKPVTDLMIRCSGNYEPVTTSQTIIAEKGSGVFNLGLDYKTNFDKDEYKPGSYEATLVYTISSRS